MTVEEKQQETQELDFNFDDIYDEDEEVDVNNIPISSPVLNNAVDFEILQEKHSKLEQELQKITSALEVGRKTNYLEEVFSKYADIDPAFKDLVADSLGVVSRLSTEQLKPIYEYFEALKRDQVALKQQLQQNQQYIANVQADFAYHKMVKKGLERMFKKSDINETVLEKAQEAHAKRMQRDSAYKYEIDRVANHNNLKEREKEVIIANKIAETFKEFITKKKKVSDEDPTIKKRVEKDKSLESAQKKLDKEDAKEQKSLEERTPEERASSLETIRNKLRRF